MTILQNAIDSIVLGIEDYESSDKRRLISCARNMFAGILLLYKHKLAELSPVGSDEVLLKQYVLPVRVAKGSVEWRGRGKKTVDVKQIQELFSSLGISVDWARLEAINQYRNDVEHYYSMMSHDSVRALIADSFILIRDFVRAHLGLEPLDLLGSEAWRVLTNISEVYAKEKDRCSERIRSVDWRFAILEDALLQYRCTECGSGLIDIDNTNSDHFDVVFQCLSCAAAADFESVATKAVSDHFAHENFSAIKDGGEPATIDCPECGHETYLMDENICVICEACVERECQHCGIPIPSSEINGDGICGWCAHMMSKDD